MKRETVVLAGLLHDIGKIIYRALLPSERYGQRHQELGFTWAREMGLPVEVQEAIRRHHAVRPDDAKYRELSPEAYSGPLEVRNLIYLVGEGDNIAAGMERPEGPGEGTYEVDQGLGVIFDRVSLSTERSQRHVWQPELLEDAPYPIPDDPAVRRHTAELYRSAWKRLCDSLRDSRNLQEDRLFLLLEKYLSIVPEHSLTSADSFPDTSLYHHLKTTVALSWCNYLYLTERGYCWEEDLREVISRRQEIRYLLVGGDLSGIQEFIYTIGSKAALKTVRARSFFLDLLIEAAASQLLAELSLGRSHLIYSSGGGFYLLAPNTPSCRRQLKAFQDGFNAWLYDNFGTALYLCVAYVPLSGAELKGETAGLQKAWEELHQALRLQKNRKWEALLAADPLKLLEPRPVDRECQVCHRSGGVEEVDLDGVSYDLCTFCRVMIHLGQRLPDLESFYEVEFDEAKPFCTRGPVKLTVYRSTYLFDYSPPPDAKAEYRLKDPWELSATGWPVRPFPSGAHYSQREFDKLASQAVGDKKIAVLRMDVDRLGQIFSKGLDRATFARMSDLSARLNLYFKYYLPRLLERVTGGLLPLQQRKVQVNVVYAGGDDLFLVGAWDGVVEAASAINLDFQKYTGRNPDITLSGGIVVADERVAFYRLAELAASAEDRAKEAGRNRLYLLGAVLTWEEVDRLRQYFELFRPALEQAGLTVRPKEFSHGFLRRFTALVEEYNRQGITLARGTAHREGEGRGSRMWVLPQLYYLFARARAGKKGEASREFYRKLLAASLSDDALTIFLPPSSCRPS